MDKPLQITFLDVPPSDALDAHIRDKVAKLEQFYPRIIGCQVYVELVGRHQQQGKQFNVRIDLKVPGNVLVINRNQDADVYVAARGAFDSARRQLEDYAQRQRGDVKTRGGASAGQINAS